MNDPFYEIEEIESEFEESNDLRCSDLLTDLFEEKYSVELVNIRKTNKQFTHEKNQENS